MKIQTKTFANHGASFKRGITDVSLSVFIAVVYGTLIVYSWRRSAHQELSFALFSTMMVVYESLDSFRAVRKLPEVVLKLRAHVPWLPILIVVMAMLLICLLVLVIAPGNVGIVLGVCSIVAMRYSIIEVVDSHIRCGPNGIVLPYFGFRTWDDVQLSLIDGETTLVLRPVRYLLPGTVEAYVPPESLHRLETLLHEAGKQLHVPCKN